MEKKNNKNNNMVQRCIYTVNVVKKPVKIQFLNDFIEERKQGEWGNKSTALFLSLRGKINLTCFFGTGL